MGRYDSRRQVAVKPFNGATFLYGFATNVDAADGAVLGHVEKDAITGPVVWRANMPKPARASKQKATGVSSSFVSWDAISAARAAGWRVGKAKLRTGSESTLTKTVYVTVEGIKYAWRMPNTTATNLGDIAALGIKVATPADRDLVFGASLPKPPRAKKVVSGSVVSTFYDPSTTLPAGFSVVGSGLDAEVPVGAAT